MQDRSLREARSPRSKWRSAACGLQVAAAAVGSLPFGAVWSSPVVLVYCCPPVPILDCGMLAVGLLVFFLAIKGWYDQSRAFAFLAGLVALLMIGTFFLGTALAAASLVILVTKT